MKQSPMAVLNSKTLWIASSHVAMLLLGYVMMKNHDSLSVSDDANISMQQASSSLRDRMTQGDGPELLAAFLADDALNRDLYMKYKDTIQPAADLQLAVKLAYQKFTEEGGQESAETRAMLLVRLYHWMMVDPELALDSLSKWDTRKIKQYDAKMERSFSFEMIDGTYFQVYADVINDRGVLDSLSWIGRSGRGYAMVADGLAKEIREGGGLSHYLKVCDAMQKHLPKDDDLENSIFSMVEGESIAKALPYSDRQALLGYVTAAKDLDEARYLLVGFSSSSKEAGEWVYHLIESGQLPEKLAKEVSGGLGNQVLFVNGMDLDQRVAARRFTPGNEVKDRDSIVHELMRVDLNHHLNQGRDWRFEFRHGTATLDEIVADVEGSLVIPDEARDEMRISLYRNLVEEDPAGALPLLDTFSEEERRKILFESTWTSYAFIDPNDYYAYLQTLPQPVTDAEKAERLKGWDWQARGLLERYGDDYVRWVQTLPDGSDKSAALNSIIWATREVNDAEAQRLSEQFYSKKP